MKNFVLKTFVVSAVIFLGFSLNSYSQTAEEYYNRAYEKDKLQDYRGAVADYSKAIELNPVYSIAYFRRGSAKYELQDYIGAIADFTKVIELDLKNSDAYSNRGVAKNELEDYIGAIADYSKATH